MLIFFNNSYNYLGDIMKDRVYNYIVDSKFRIIILENKINIINFKRIIEIEDDYITLQSDTKKIRITGTNFILNKLVKDELLVTGNLKNIEVLND